MKKLLYGFLILIILVILLLGSALILFQANGSKTELIPEYTETSRTIEAPKADFEPMTEVELNQSIVSKRYLENTYLALEYSKVSNDQLVHSLKGYVDNPSTMTKEEVSQLISLNERTFLNRYLKVYVTSPDKDLTELNYEMRQVLYKMKLAFDALHMYGAVDVDVTGVNIAMKDENGNLVDANGNALSEEEAMALEGEVEEETTGGINAVTEEESEEPEGPVYDINGIPVTPKEDVKEPQYNMETIQRGITLLEEANSYVDRAIKKAGIADIKIERKWIAAGISEREVLDLMDGSNRVDVDVDDSSVGEGAIDNSTREENVEIIDTNKSNAETQEYNYSIEEDASR